MIKKLKISSLRNLAGLGEVLDERCGDDVEDELELKLEDNPKSTTGTNSFSILGQMWILTTGPLVSVTVHCAELA